MSEELRPHSTDVEAQSSGEPAAQRKKAYAKPAFEHERVFETMALACGKLSPTQFTCHFNRKTS
jgi:hypothetical protein